MLEKPLGSLGLGGTTTKCNDRKYTWNEYCFREHQFRHFHNGKHTGFLENVTKTLIDQADDQNSEKREDYWRRTLKIYAPFRLNVEDTVSACFRSFGSYLLLSHLVSRLHFKYIFVATRIIF